MGAATSIIFVATKVLSWQTHVCHDKSSVTTSILLSRQKPSFVMTRVSLLQQNFCCNKNMFVTTKYFCRNKSTNINFVMTELLLRQAYFCIHTFIAIKVSLHDKSVVATNINFVTTNICHDKNRFVATKLLSRAMVTPNPVKCLNPPLCWVL